jgi:hypothetical protein
MKVQLYSPALYHLVAVNESKSNLIIILLLSRALANADMYTWSGWKKKLNPLHQGFPIFWSKPALTFKIFHAPPQNTVFINQVTICNN